MKSPLILLVLITCSFFSCKKDIPDIGQFGKIPTPSYKLPLPIIYDSIRYGGPHDSIPNGGPHDSIPNNFPPATSTILVDASKDGGGWWYPQYGTYNAELGHQGKNLVNYLRSQGYNVDELPRGATITTDLLSRYDNVICAAPFFPYSSSEVAAYSNFLSRPVSLLMIQDHHTNTTNDLLSISLHLNFEGAQTGMITSIQPHAITTGVSSVNFIAGSYIRHPDPATVIPLGFINVGGVNACAMGILSHPSARIFFIGDINGLELVPQPFTMNLTKWLFR